MKSAAVSVCVKGKDKGDEVYVISYTYMRHAYIYVHLYV